MEDSADGGEGEWADPNDSEYGGEGDNEWADLNESDPYGKSTISEKVQADTYDQNASMIAASISASSGTSKPASGNQSTAFLGVSASLSTPTGGAELNAGFYSDQYGTVGAYYSLGPTAGIPSVSVGITSGTIEGLSGPSVSASGSVGLGPAGVSYNTTFNPTTGAETGSSVTAGFSVGGIPLGPISMGAAVGYSETHTTEFTSLYESYVEFVNFVERGTGY